MIRKKDPKFYSDTQPGIPVPEQIDRAIRRTLSIARKDLWRISQIKAPDRTQDDMRATREWMKALALLKKTYQHDGVATNLQLATTEALEQMIAEAESANQKALQAGEIPTVPLVEYDIIEVEDNQ